MSPLLILLKVQLIKKMRLVRLLLMRWRLCRLLFLIGSSNHLGGHLIVCSPASDLFPIYH
jgi:hypothetical protein